MRKKKRQGTSAERKSDKARLGGLRGGSTQQAARDFAFSSNKVFRCVVITNNNYEKTLKTPILRCGDLFRAGIPMLDERGVYVYVEQKRCFSGNVYYDCALFRLLSAFLFSAEKAGVFVFGVYSVLYRFDVCIFGFERHKPNKPDRLSL
ncbi:MAG: hypothetical protein J1F03_07660 [Oscillospiraceae bacterium]|nr:hypothetical protein [Oscillospiraceae bacterium]